MKEGFRSPSMDGDICITLNKDTGRKWVANKREVLNAIIRICEDYDSQGYRLTLRQLYYQLVAKDYIPNHDKVYKKLSSLKDEVVYSGLVDWNIFEDRGRIPQRSYFEYSVEDALGRTKRSYALNKQNGQPNHIEVWTEKDAISDILSRVTRPLTIHLVINKGYSSSTAMYAAYDRFVDKLRDGKKIVILYFGDHDPSGLDMIRDINDRTLFFMNNGIQKDSELEEVIEAWTMDGSDMSDACYAYNHDEDCCREHSEGDYFDSSMAFFKHHFKIVPIGLTMKQIEEYKPPHNPAKITDPRAKGYVKLFGQKSWEVDALTPPVMTKIVKDAIYDEMDQDTYQNVLDLESADKTRIDKMIDSL